MFGKRDRQRSRSVTVREDGTIDCKMCGGVTRLSSIDRCRLGHRISVANPEGIARASTPEAETVEYDMGGDLLAGITSTASAAPVHSVEQAPAAAGASAVPTQSSVAFAPVTSGATTIPAPDGPAPSDAGLSPYAVAEPLSGPAPEPANQPEALWAAAPESAAEPEPLWATAALAEATTPALTEIWEPSAGIQPPESEDDHADSETHDWDFEDLVTWNDPVTEPSSLDV